MEKNLNKNVEVYDDAIPKVMQDFFELLILGTCDGEDVISPVIEFTCKYEHSAPEEERLNEALPLSFVHILRSSSNKSKYLPQFANIAEIASSRIGVNMIDIPLARIYVQPPSIHNTKFYTPHVDQNQPHIVVLYYVNDSDGDTYLFNDDGTVMRTVSPKKGRFVVFDGSIMHGGGVPKKGVRSVINLNVFIG